MELAKELLMLQIPECLMARPVRTVHRLVIFIRIKDEVILLSPEMEADAAQIVSEKIFGSKEKYLEKLRGLVISPFAGQFKNVMYVVCIV